jgi:NAD(P)H-dependent FMN reductase
MENIRIVGIVGSLRKDSLNKKAMQNIERLAPEGVQFSYADIAPLSLYNSDNEKDFPSEAQALKDAILSADGVIIATPEYNRSVPGGLKNAIDWASRPYGDSAWEGKVVAITGVSSGRIGTAVAQSHLKGIMLYLNAHLFGQPELYIGELQNELDEGGNITNEKLVQSIQKFWEEFIKTIQIYKK